ncbi:hypothetical protein [Bradyrhizobium sp. Gha]|uniref:hypothetical protein n=1 Tax=Bradyrhizobium sp. Gha TaxID=1855318 RepID=UPI001FCE1C12|nr:hypothetical protein [Bradyrhizobium sp. Gha]
MNDLLNLPCDHDQLPRRKLPSAIVFAINVFVSHQKLVRHAYGVPARRYEVVVEEMMGRAVHDPRGFACSELNDLREDSVKCVSKSGMKPTGNVHYLVKASERRAPSRLPNRVLRKELPPLIEVASIQRKRVTV